MESVLLTVVFQTVLDGYGMVHWTSSSYASLQLERHDPSLCTCTCTGSTGTDEQKAFLFPVSNMVSVNRTKTDATRQYDQVLKLL